MRLTDALKAFFLLSKKGEDEPAPSIHHFQSRWYARRDSNPRPQRSQRCALSPELRAYKKENRKEGIRTLNLLLSETNGTVSYWLVLCPVELPCCCLKDNQCCV